jgi:hypothetical protein
LDQANFFMDDAGFYMACFLNNLTTSPGSLEKEAICGRIIDREELKNQPIKGEMVVRSQTEQEMITPSGVNENWGT